MKRIGYAGAAVMTVGLAAFSIHAGAAPDEPASADMVAPRLAHDGQPDLEPLAATARQTVEVARPAAPRRDEPEARPADTRPREIVSRDREDDRRGRWRRSRNRWAWRYESLPGPEEWRPPEGPVRIALQAGHWRADEAPPELSGLRDNGTRGGGRAEWQVNLEIAKRAAALLEARGYAVDVLPAVVPPGYRAHLFIAIHADGSENPAATGFRVAAPRRDPTGRAQRMARLLEQTYGQVTGLPRLPTITRRMSSYYAFNYGRYEHSLHPWTIAVIIETGFLTSASDRRLIVDDPDRVARGIVEAVLRFPETPPPDRAEGSGGSGGAAPGTAPSTEETASTSPEGGAGAAPTGGAGSSASAAGVGVTATGGSGSSAPAAGVGPAPTAAARNSPAASASGAAAVGS